MSVAMAPNWSRIRGLTQAVTPAAEYRDYAVVRVKVEAVEPVEGFANLLANASGQEVAVLIPNEQAERLGLAPGQEIAARVRRAGLDRIFAHPEEVTVRDAPR